MTGKNLRAKTALQCRDESTIISGEKTDGSASMMPRSIEGRAPCARDRIKDLVTRRGEARARACVSRLED